MYLEVKGICSPDEKWRKMKEAYDACTAADVEPPDEVMSFFGEDNPPHSDGAVVELGTCEDSGISGEPHYSVSGIRPREMSLGFRVDLSELPDNITHLEFTWTH